MRCHLSQDLLSGYLEGPLPEAQRSAVSAHLEVCRACVAQIEELRGVEVALRGLPAVEMPPRLASELQVLASREQARQREHGSWGSLFAAWGRRAGLAADNLMRPLALPFAGGLLSTLSLFAMLAPTLGTRVPISASPALLQGVLGMVSTDAAVTDLAPFEIDRDVIVDVVIDQNGRMVDYHLPQGQVSAATLANIGNVILFTTFSPAKAFGQPTQGRIRLSFRAGHRIVVRG